MSVVLGSSSVAAKRYKMGSPHSDSSVSSSQALAAKQRLNTRLFNANVFGDDFSEADDDATVIVALYTPTLVYASALHQMLPHGPMHDASKE